MRNAVLITLIILLLAPLVSAGELTYYPNEKAFQEFLNSSSAYTVVAGSDNWAEGWAYYVDSRLSTIKPHGKDTIVVVGNVYNNRLMAELWPKTGLPEKLSLKPSVIVLDKAVLITGSEDNIYLTERAFGGMWNPPRQSLLAFLLLGFFLFLLFTILLRGDRNYAGSFYAITVSLYILWVLNSGKPHLTDGFLRSLLSSLEFTAGGSPSSPLGYLMGLFFRYVPPIEENIILMHWLLVFLVLSFSFYLAPKRARDLGFLVVGFVLVAPMFRSALDSVSGISLGLAAFVITLAIINNVTFSPEKWKAFIQTLVLSFFTLLAIAINPYLLFIPFLFAIAFPKRHLRNHAYLVITGLGILLLYLRFPFIVVIPRGISPEAVEYLQKFLMEGGLLLLTAFYAVVERKDGIWLRGQTAFLLLSTLLYIPMAMFLPSLFPYTFILLAALAVRLVNSLTPA